MKVEHITLGGNAVIRDTLSVSDAVKNKLRGIDGSTQYLNITEIPFGIRITVTQEGAIFNLEKDEQPVFVTYCCFEGNNSSLLLSLVDAVNIFKIDIIEPVTPDWLYTAILGIASPQDSVLAGEIELYIYEAIREQWIKKYGKK